MEYTELAEAYIQWNKALVKRFFPENAEDNVRIFVTPDVLNDIGEENELGNHEDFLKMMLVSSEDRSAIYQSVCSILGVQSNTLRKDNNIWHCALVYAGTKGLENKLPDPYFNYLILLMYIAWDYEFNKQNPKWSLGEHITTHFFNDEIEKKTISENTQQLDKDNAEKTIDKTTKRSSYSDIGNLFDRLASQHPEFNNIKLTQQEYIGRIRYQIGLTDGQRTILERALYNCEDRLDGMTFKEQCYYLRDYIGDEKLLKQLDDDSWELTLSELIDNFDPEEYEEKISDRRDNESTRQTHRGELFLALDDNDELVLLTKTKDRDIEITEGDTTYTVYSCRDSYGEYNSNPVQIRKDDQIQKVELQEYRFNGFAPLPFVKDNVIIFQELNDSPYLVQTRKLSPNLPTYVLVKKLKKGEKGKYINQWELSQCYADNKFLTDEKLSLWAKKIFGEDWVCYFSEMHDTCTQYFSIPTPNSKTTKAQYGFAGGIRLGNGYLFTALPYLKLPSPIERSLLSECTLALRNKNGEIIYLTEGRDYKLIFGDQNLVFDLLIKRQEQDKYSVPLMISVKYNSEIYTKELNVKWLPLVFNHEDLHMYDAWGQLVENEESAFLRGNTLLTRKKRPAIGSVYQLYHDDKVHENLDSFRNKFYFSALLTACCLTSQDYSITRCKLEKCIRYACTRSNLPLPDQKTTDAFIKKISSAGFINIVHKSNRQKYQFVPPALVEIPQKTGQLQRMALIGAYTYGFLDDFDAFCKSHNIILHYESPKAFEGLDQLLPPIVLVGRDRMLKHIDIFTKEKKHQLVAISDFDYPLALLQGANGLMEFNDTLSKVNPISERWLKPSKCQQYPQVRSLNNTIASSSKQYLQDKDKTTFYESSINDSDYLWTWAAYLRKEPILRTINKKAKIVLAFRRNSLPYLLEKATFLMGLEHIHEGKIFVVNSKNIAYPLFERADITEIYDKNDIVPRVKELYNKLYPGYEHGSWEFLHKFKGREPIVSMKLYQIRNNKRRWIILPKYILHCLIEYKFKLPGFSYNETLNVCATSSKLWLKEGGTVYHWDGLKGSVNTIISALLSSNTQFKDLGLVQCDANQYPDLNLYEDPEELIIVNESIKNAK